MGVSVSPFFGSHLHGKYQNDPSSYSKMSLVKELHNLIAESILSHNLLKHSHLLVSRKEESYLMSYKVVKSLILPISLKQHLFTKCS